MFIFIDIDDCNHTKEYFSEHEPCFSGVDCRDRKAPRRGFDCGPCPKGFVGNGKICQKEGEQEINLLLVKIKICFSTTFSYSPTNYF